MFDNFASEWERVLEGDYATQADVAVASMEFLPLAMDVDRALQASGAHRDTLVEFVATQPERAKSILKEIATSHERAAAIRARSRAFVEHAKALPRAQPC